MSGWVDVSRQRAELMASQGSYARDITSWLSRVFPELTTDAGPHRAAFVEVIRLHYVHGKGSLTRAEHGDDIRAAVQAWETKWGGAKQQENT